jgi:hypothetical protein
MTAARTTSSTLRLPARSRAIPTSNRLATRRVPAVAIPLLAVLLGGGVVVAAQATGHWSTTGRDAVATAGGGGAAVSDGTGPGSGTGTGGDTSALPASPDDVKGWMTLQQVLDAAFPGVTEAGLRARFAIPATIGLGTPLKDLDGTVAGFDVATLRTWLAAPA